MPPPPGLCINARAFVRLFVLHQRISFIEGFGLLNFVRQPPRRLAHVKLTRDHVGDQAGAVLADEVDFTVYPCQCSLNLGYAFFQCRDNAGLFFPWRH
jgi:hypothetical protein